MKNTQLERLYKEATKVGEDKQGRANSQKEADILLFKRVDKLRNICEEIVILFPKASRKLVDNSDDFQWGYGGSGPAQLALALLLDATGDTEIALRYYQQFKDEYVSIWLDRWGLTRDMIREWVKIQEEKANG